MSPKRKKDLKASWHELAYDFTQRTTLHGVRYITEETPFTVRRLLWAVLVLACVSGFFYVTISQLLYLLSRPKAVNVEVISAKVLNFPTVTICNQNYFRGSRTFEMGLYDKVESYFTKDILGNDDDVDTSTDGCHDDAFDLKESIYLTSWNSRAYSNFALDWSTVGTYIGITVRVCKQLCRHYHSALCNSIVYDYTSKTCHVSKLSPYMEGTWQTVHLDVDTWVRNRCNGKRLTVCDFEGSPCPMYQEPETPQRWLKRAGPSSTSGTGPHRDHTQANGFYMTIDATYPQEFKRAELFTPFIQATEADVCLQFAYSMRGLPGDMGTLSVNQLYPQGVVRIVWSNRVLTQTEWDLKVLNLGLGIFQVVFEATLGNGPLGDIALDDIIIGPCRKFVTACKQTIKGSEYLGTLSETSAGDACAQWNDTGYVSPTLSGGPEMAHAYCRNPDDDPRGPWCMVDSGADGGLVKQYCNVSFCSCSENQFTCHNGLCIPRLAACDTFDDCGDMSDETHGCVTSVDCDFEQRGVCGYTSPADSVTTKWIQYSGRMRNGHLRLDATSPNGRGHYLYLDSGTSLLASRQRIYISSPVYRPSNETNTMHEIGFYSYTFADVLFPEGMGEIVVYQQFARFDRRPRFVVRAEDANQWMSRQVLLVATSREFRLVFEAIVGQSYYSDMAIDGVSIQPLPPGLELNYCEPDFTCRSYRCLNAAQTCDGQNDCGDFSDEDEFQCSEFMTIECGFNGDFKCGYRDESNPDTRRWERGKTPIAGISNYMKFAHDKQRPSILKRLISPRSAGGAACLSFQHHQTMDSRTSLCPISVFQEFYHERTLTYRVGKRLKVFSQLMWDTAFVSLDPSDDYQVAFEVQCSSLTAALYIGLANIQVTKDGSCEDRFANGSVPCDFNGDSCGYLDKSTEGLNWFLDQGSMAAGMTAKSDKDSAEVYLLSPTLNVTEPSCVRMAFQAHFENLLQRGPTIEIRILDIYNNNSLIWATRMDYLDEVKGRIPLEPGPHRFAFYALIPGGATLRLLEVTVNGTEDICDHKGLCSFPCLKSFGVCIPSIYTCDWINHCWYGEDESFCPPAPAGDAGPAGPIGERTEGKGYNNPDGRKIPVTPDREAEILPVFPSTLNPKENLTNYYYKAGHDKADLIYRCQWAGAKCSHEDFMTEVTDYGLCHTFNSGKDSQPVRKTKNTGASSALRLILNIEEYDYMRGPHSDAGVKMFLCDENEVPMVRDLGFGVAPGDHALVGVKLSQMSSLSRPWGSCGETDLPFGGNYTYSSCVRQCESLAMVEACGCRDAYMPGFSYDEPPICNVSTFLECVIKISDMLGARRSDCNCTDPCVRNIYESRLSYTALSSLNVDQLLSSNLQELYRRHVAVLEVNQRVTPQVFMEDLRILSNIVSDYSRILSFSLSQIWQPFSSILLKVEQSALFLIKTILNNDMKSTLMGQLGRYTTAFDTAFGLVYTSLDSYSTRLLVDLDILLRKLDGAVMKKERIAHVLPYIERTLEDLSTLKETITIYSYSQQTASSVFSSPTLKLNDNVTRYLSQSQNLETAEDCSNTVDTFTTDVIPLLQTLLEDLRRSVGLGVSSPHMTDSGLSSLYNMTRSSVKPSLIKSKECLSEFHSFLKELGSWKESMFAQLHDLEENFKLASATGATVDDILDYVDESDPLLKNKNILDNKFQLFKANSSRKIDIAMLFNDSSVSAATQLIDTFVSRIRLRLFEPGRRRIEEVESFTSSTYISLIRYERQMSRYLASNYDGTPLKEMWIWSRPKANLEDASNPGYADDAYQFENDFQFAQVQATKIAKELVAWYTMPLKEAINWVEQELLQRHQDLKKRLETANQRWTAYKEGTMIGANYIKKNFLQVDIFFSQLKYQHIQQIKTYSGDSFFSDVGGFMGLLLGGSIITLFEFLDLIAYNLCRRYRCGKPRQSDSISNNMMNHPPAQNENKKLTSTDFSSIHEIT